MDKNNNRYFEIQYSGSYTILGQSSTTCGTTGADVPGQPAWEMEAWEMDRRWGGAAVACEGRVEYGFAARLMDPFGGVLDDDQVLLPGAVV